MGRKSGVKAQDEPDESFEDSKDVESKETKSAVEGKNPIEAFLENKEFEEFVQISKLTGILSVEPYHLQKDDQERFVEAFQSWLKAGKPKPQMPQEATKHIEIIEKLYRARDKGREYLYYIAKGKPLPVGIIRTPIYNKVTVDGKEIEDRSLQIGYRDEYDPEFAYTKELAEKLLAKIQRDTSDVKLFLVEGIGDSRSKVRIRNPKNFTRNIDDLLEDIRKGKAL